MSVLTITRAYAHCHNDFIPTNRRGPRHTYCSERCRTLTNHPPPTKHTRSCLQRGQPTTGPANRRFCSHRCATKALRPPKPRRTGPNATCQHCGKVYHPKSCKRVTYCSRGCTFAAKNVRAEARRERERGEREAACSPIC